MKTRPVRLSILLPTVKQCPSMNEYFAVIEEALLAAGITLLQLREKDLPAVELHHLAGQLRELTRRHDCLLLLNDRIDIALAVQADGVHLGRQSVPANVARRILGPQALIGVSTHSIAEIEQAHDQGADFVTFGPVYYTASKARYGAPLGIESLRHACARSPIPIYALGGIKEERVAELKAAGAYGVAAISAFMAAASPAAVCKRFLTIIAA